uniref:Cytochrome c oxidase subunit 3 n=1 Tax=Prosthogonimus cuneatus TaxID=232414 RepID=A0A7L7S1G2_9TREM|nr:cytochrome c oxidase subunit III [Prosthogonimus cuneatus]QNU39788.1 cytochrome c oxidase subunit III [Prosthogonimus cuneatus]
MSWLPLFYSFVIFLFLVSVFLWLKLGVFVSLFLVLFSVFYYLVSEVSVLLDRRPFSFLLFIVSEALVFATLFVTTMWFEDGGISTISDWFNLPLVGCLLLVSSSFAVTVYHNLFDPTGDSWSYLVIAIFLGLGFVFLQLFEVWECLCDFTFCSYYSSAFSTIGLHFFHVVLGLVVLGYVCFCSFRGGLSFYHITLSIWYWHFVDYIWLIVFVVVYLI